MNTMDRSQINRPFPPSSTQESTSDCLNTHHPEYGPCSACGDGDTELRYHSHEPRRLAFVIDLRDLDALEEIYHAQQPDDSCVGLRKLFVGNFLKWQRELMREFIDAEQDADTRSELEWTFERFLQWARRKQEREGVNVKSDRR